jgi:uncharacterized membrane protein YccC
LRAYIVVKSERQAAMNSMNMSAILRIIGGLMLAAIGVVLIITNMSQQGVAIMLAAVGGLSFFNGIAAYRKYATHP